jgi:hypothetical protein
VLDGVLKAFVPALGHPRQFDGEIGWGFAANVLTIREKGWASGERAAVEETDAEFNVARADAFAVGDFMNAVAGAIAGVPQFAKKLAQFTRGEGLRLLQDEQIDVGVRKQFPPAIATDGQQPAFLPLFGAYSGLPDTHHEVIHLIAASLHLCRRGTHKQMVAAHG